MIYFSPSTGGFYLAQLHGPRTVWIADPAWTQPMIRFSTTGPDGEPVETEAPDPDAQPPLIEVDNPDCRVPSDAVEVSEEDHAALLAAQSQGLRITAGEDGQPVALQPNELSPS